MTLKLNGDATIEGAGYVYPITRAFESPQQAFTAAGLITLAHGLGKVPAFTRLDLVCATAEAGYSAGDVVETIHHFVSISGTTQTYGAVAWRDAVNVSVRVAAGGFLIPGKVNGVATGTTPANWRLVVRAFA